MEKGDNISLKALFQKVGQIIMYSCTSTYRIVLYYIIIVFVINVIMHNVQ